MPESPTVEAKPGRFRLIPTKLVRGSKMFNGTVQAATAYGNELAVTHNCDVLLSELDERSRPKTVTIIRAPKTDSPVFKNSFTNHQGDPMGTTSIAPEPRTSNGEKAPVKDNLDESQVLTPEQKAELKVVKEAKALRAQATATQEAGRKTEVKDESKAAATDIAAATEVLGPRPKAEKKPKAESTRLKSHEDGDPEGSRRCTHPLHDGGRLFTKVEDGGFYRYPTGAYGSWCSACRKASAKASREAKLAAKKTETVVEAAQESEQV